MSNLINFDSTIAQALNHFDQQGQSQQQQQEQQQQAAANRDSRGNDRYPIDPSIGDSTSTGTNDKNDDSVTQELAQAAVEQSADKQAKQVVQSSHLHHHHQQPRDAHKVTKPRVNKPGQKFGAKKKSWVWNWFTQDPVDWNIAICSLCQKPIKRLESDKGSPKKLGEHLKTHKISPETTNDNNSQQLSAGNDSTTSVTGSSENLDANRHYFSTINSTPTTFKNHDSNSKSQHTKKDGQVSGPESGEYSSAVFLKQIIKFLIENKLPLSVVESPSFKQIIQILKPEVVPDLEELHRLNSPLLDLLNGQKEDHEEQEGVLEIDDGNVDEQLHNTGSSWV